jgi:DNA-binding PadR family transcriptional regulator
MFQRIFESERHPRLFAKGDIKYVILDLIKSKPSYGYEIMHSLEEHFHGFYSPSAGSVYPTLQMLEDMGYVISSERDGKKVYTISDKGRRFLTDRKDDVHRIKIHMRDWWGENNREELRESFRELRSIIRLLSRKTRRMNTAKLSRIKQTIAETSRNIERIIEEE